MTMKRFAVLFLAFLCVATLASTAAAEERRVDLSGAIAAVGDHGILLHTHRGDVRIHVVARTRIFRNGERVRLPALHVRDQARVRAVIKRTRHGVRLFAIEIHARGR